jgi:S1-C subfamily serine protease
VKDILKKYRRWTMRFFLCAMMIMFMLGCNQLKPTHSRDEIITHIIKSVPMVVNGSATGSCILFKRGDEAMALTAAHVVAKHEDKQVGPYLPIETETPLIPIQVIGWNSSNDSILWVCSAEIVCEDTKMDFAILRLLSTSPEMEFASFSGKTASFGERVFMVGSPMLDASTLSEGIVCHPHRNPALGNTSGLRYIHTDAIGCFGSSGGGLFREQDGLCIGVVVLRDPSYGAMYALPIVEILPFISDYIKISDLNN